MANTRKFGTFSGVFTPSILTILGVIMYMRLPAIVGEAGLYATIGIILVAHIISVTTGLSVSSIATDRRVQGGGTYYMISRSLGLPIGGTLGIALFVGLSFSVSLYLIGFAESFLGYWDFEITKNTIRLAGTAILLVVTTVTLISTSLAIKTQYIIMTAIGLSLISLFFGSHDFAPAQPWLSNPSGSVPLMVLFGIFFPAVTGFEAGVSMSGDLRDPKKSIPIGAIAAIAVGFFVYTGMAFYFSYTVDPKLLADDPGVLLKISLVPELVIAGIWGATLSSAMGSILGAPRILQATAQDKIAPKFFAKPSGKLKEPRNALILTFLIAEGGILVGELDVIARVVSIFFIMTYGFINLSAAFETMTSAEFRPEFKTPFWVSLIGAAACILVMIQLDLLALFGASLVLGLLFFHLKRKELTLESGDAWSGVWASIVKTGIVRLGRERTRESNWRPNIIMYSGNREQRSHLVQFGNAICGHLGILSSFELIKNPDKKGLRRIEDSGADPGADRQQTFSYQYHCTDFYEGMDEVSRLYGFHGVEPNTILMGWSRNPENRAVFSRLLASYNTNGFNIILLSHDEKWKFGEGKTIDVWWNESNSDLSFSLVLLRYLIRTNFWNGASLRLLVINYDNSRKEQIHRKLENILENYRLQMDIRIINNQDTEADENEIIQKNSEQTDLTIIGMDDAQVRSMDTAFPRLDKLLSNLGTTAVIHGTAGFETIDAGVARVDEKTSEPLIRRKDAIPEPVIPSIEDPVLSGDIQRARESGARILNRFYGKTIQPCFAENISQIEKYRGIAVSVCNSLRKALDYRDEYRYGKALLKIKNDYAFNCRRLFEDVQEKLPSTYSESLASGIGWYIEWFNKFYLKYPRRHRIIVHTADSAPMPGDSILRNIYKLWNRTRHRITGRDIFRTIPYRKIAKHYLHDTRHEYLASYLQDLYKYEVAYLARLKAFILSLMGSIESLEERTSSTEADLQRIEETLRRRLDSCAEELNLAAGTYRENLHNEFRENLAAMARRFISISGSYGRIDRPKTGKYYSNLAAQNRSFNDRWTTTLNRITNKISLDIIIAALRCRTEDRLKDFLLRITQQIDTRIYNAVRQLETDLQSMLQYAVPDVKQVQCEIDTSIDIEEGMEEVRDQFLELSHELPDELPVGDDDTEEMDIPVVRLVDRILGSRLVAPLQEYLASGNESLRNAAYRMNDLVNLTRFSLKNVNNTLPDSQKVTEELLRNALTSTRKERELIESFKTSLQEEIDTLLADAFDPLSPEKIEKSSGELAEILREVAGQKVLSTFGHWKNTLHQFLEKRIIRLLYSRSEGLLLARKLKTRDAAVSGNAPLVDLVQSVNPERNVMRTLPRFYVNLFSSRSSIGTEFFIRREEDESRMQKAVEHYKNGHKGGILVLGERNTGKTAFCKQITANLFPKNNIVHIFAPNEGSTSSEDLARTLGQATGIRGTSQEILAALPHETVLIIHDLELWFEQHREGTPAVRRLAGLMDDFCDRILFIINSNPHSFALIDSIEPIGYRFIRTVRLTPFSAENLKDMILLRHHSSGLQFRWKGRDEKKLSGIRLAALFDAYFTFSEGNPGMALNAWLNSIHRFSGSILDTRTPAIPDLSALRKTNEDMLVLWSVFVLHKRLTAEKLMRITGMEESELDRMLHVMRRCGLIEERGRGILILNMFLEPFIIKVLIEKQIL